MKFLLSCKFRQYIKERTEWPRTWQHWQDNCGSAAMTVQLGQGSSGIGKPGQAHRDRSIQTGPSGQVHPDRSIWTGPSGQVYPDRSACLSLYRTERTKWPEQDNKTGQLYTKLGQESLGRTAITGQSGPDSRDRTSWQDSKDRTEWTGYPEEVSWAMSAWQVSLDSSV
jgi:hypothetical protein